jgi:hypothetical protein
MKAIPLVIGLIGTSGVYDCRALVAAGNSTKPPEAETTECSGHGELHGDHCHCDSGYETPSQDELTCVLVSGAKQCDIAGNIDATELPSAGSVAFVTVDGEYRFIRKPGMASTSLSLIDSSCEHAYGWSRDKPADDDSARESSWVLNLATGEFKDIEIPNASWVVVRNGRDDGTVVGKLGLDPGTPDDRSDDQSRGFIHHVDTGETELVEREGFLDIGFTAISADDVVLGFNDFGAVGFAYANAEFKNLETDAAYRLFPFQIAGSGHIIGFWGSTEDNWFERTVNPSFVAEPEGDGYRVNKFELAGFSGTGLTGLNDAGEIAGIAYETPTSRAQVFRAESLNAEPQFYPLQDNLDPFPTGISATGVVYGEAYLVALEPPPLCAGHGTIEQDTCVCDEGYVLDPYEAQNCIEVDAVCDGHGHLHGDVCHCDAGYQTDPADSSRCIPQ